MNRLTTLASLYNAVEEAKGENTHTHTHTHKHTHIYIKGGEIARSRHTHKRKKGRTNI